MRTLTQIKNNLLIFMLVFLTMIEVANAQNCSTIIYTPSPILSMTGGQNLGGSGTFKYTLHDPTATPLIRVGTFTNYNSYCDFKSGITYSLTSDLAGFVTGSSKTYTLDRSKALGPYPQTIALHLSVDNFWYGASRDYYYSFILYDCDDDLIAPTT